MRSERGAQEEEGCFFVVVFLNLCLQRKGVVGYASV